VAAFRKLDAVAVLAARLLPALFAAVGVAVCVAAAAGLWQVLRPLRQAN